MIEVSHEKTGSQLPSQSQHVPWNLNNIPREMLSIIAWYSLNPHLCQVDRRLRASLPTLERFRIDTRVLLFTSWQVSQRSLLKFRTSLANQFTLQFADDERETLQRQCLEAAWCSLGSLKRAAARISFAWISHHWTTAAAAQNPQDHHATMFTIENHYDDILAVPAAQTIHSADGKHTLSIYDLVHAQVSCTYTCRRRHCPHPSLPPLPLLHTACVPSRLLTSLDLDEAYINDHLSFLHLCRRSSTEYTHQYHERHWSDALVRTSITRAITHDDPSLLRHLLLLYARQTGTACRQKHHFGELDHGFIPDMVTLAACRSRWGLVRIIIKQLHDHSGVPKAWFSPATIEYLQ